MSHVIQACALVHPFTMVSNAARLWMFSSDHILLANKTFGDCLSKHCLDHDGLENLSQKIPLSVLKSGIRAFCKSLRLNFRHNCTGEKPEKKTPVNSYKLVENMFSRWSRGCQTTVDDCIWNKFSVHYTSSCILEVSPGISTQLLWGSTHGSAKGLFARQEALAQALTKASCREETQKKSQWSSYKFKVRCKWE